MQQAVKAAFDSVAVKQAAIAFHASEVQADESVKAVALAMGTKPTFTLWNLVSTQWQSDYKAAAKCSEDASRKAWSRLAARMNKNYGLEKPTAVTVDSKKKAAARAEDTKAVKAVLAKHKGDSAAIMKEAAAAFELGKAQEARTLQKAAMHAAAAADKAVKEKQAARWVAVDKAVKAAKKAARLQLLESLERMLGIATKAAATKTK
jgi:hypothetical protein